MPGHFITQLSHLQSRPDVQSTLILSRKDGSIIQATGQLGQLSTPNPTSTPNPEPATESEPQDSTTTNPESADTPPTEPTEQESPAQTDTQPEQVKPYKPSQAETLAAHIFAYVSSASALSTCLSRSTAGDDQEAEYGGSNTQSTPQNPVTEGQDNKEGHPEEDDELKLLRLRTKVHEIIIFPDRRFLLCVVHDLAAMGGSSGGR